MSTVLDFIELDHLLPVVTLIILLALVGNKMAGGRQSVHTWARRAAAAGFIFSAAVLIDHLQPVTPAEFLIVVIRSLMATGLVWSASTVGLAVGVWLHDVVFLPAAKASRISASRLADFRHQRATERAASEAALVQQQEQRRRAERNARALRRSRKQADIADQERIARLKEARDEVSRFYDEHFDKISGELPRPLFHVRLHNKLHPGVSAVDAWGIAEEMISMIMTLVNDHRENLEHKQERERQIQAQVATLQQQINEIQRQKNLFAQSPTADAEVVAHELRAFDNQIEALRDQITAIQTPDEASK